jgi:CrcB protein
MLYLALAAGGVIGGILRYLMELVPSMPGLPLDTLWVNLSGSMLLGMFNGFWEHVSVKPWIRIGLGSGVIGAFTTFSTFCLDITKLHSTALATLYLAATLIGGPLLALTGHLMISFTLRRIRQTPEEASV